MSLRTYTGRKFWPLNPRAEDLDIRDIAHALSQICRWGGHTYCFYSVAEHSLRVSKLAEQLALADWRRVLPTSTGGHSYARDVALWGLLHDASEAYLCDLPSPLKHAPGMGQLYKTYEARLMEMIATRYELEPHMPPAVKRADAILLNTEARDLMTGINAEQEDWYQPSETLPETIYPMELCAEAEFMRRFDALTAARQAERLASTLDTVTYIATALSAASSNSGS